METFIYRLQHPVTKEIKYIGKTISPKRRLKQHINEAKTSKKKRYVLNWIISLLNQGLKPEMIIVEECNKDNWQEKEIYWISYYKPLTNLCNISTGGLGGFGIKNYSDIEIQKRISQMSNKFSKFSLEDKIKIWELLQNRTSLTEIQKIYPNITRNIVFQVISGRTWNNVTKLPKITKTEGYQRNKLTKEQREEIKYLSKVEGLSNKEIAKRYPINSTSIWKIVNN